MNQSNRFIQWTRTIGVNTILKELHFRGFSITRSSVYAWRRGGFPRPDIAKVLVAISRPMKKENRLRLEDIYCDEQEQP